MSSEPPIVVRFTPNSYAGAVPMRNIPIPARVYIALIVLLGLSSLAGGLWFWQCQNQPRFFGYLALSLLCSGLKVVVPGIQGSMSVNYMIFLAGFIQLSLPETLAVGLASCFMQSFWHATKRPHLIQVVFNVAQIAIAITGGHWIYHLDTARLVGFDLQPAYRLGAATCAYYLLNTVSMALVVALTEHKNAIRIWKNFYLWSLPYYLLGASIIGGPLLFFKQSGWIVALFLAPCAYSIFQVFSMYLCR